MLQPSLKKYIRKLHQKKYREEFGTFLVEGMKGVAEALISDVEIQTIIVEEKRKEELDFVDIIQKAEEQGIEVVYAAQKDIGEIKTTDTFPGVQAVVSISESNLEDIQNKEPIICLDRVQDPGNIGTIIRTADWFGIPNILLSEDCVDPHNPKAVRSTMGSIFHTSLYKSPDIVQTAEALKELGYRIITLSTEGQIVKDGEFANKKTVYILGNESRGVRKDLVDISTEMYSIPGSGRAESLNVAVAAGILMNETIMHKQNL
jgi:TrmH family RNA methyltransferase